MNTLQSKIWDHNGERQSYFDGTLSGLVEFLNGGDTFEDELVRPRELSFGSPINGAVGANISVMARGRTVAFIEFVELPPRGLIKPRPAKMPVVTENLVNIFKTARIQCGSHYSEDMVIAHALEAVVKEIYR